MCVCVGAKSGDTHAHTLLTRGLFQAPLPRIAAERGERDGAADRERETGGACTCACTAVCVSECVFVTSSDPPTRNQGRERGGGAVAEEEALSAGAESRIPRSPPEAEPPLPGSSLQLLLHSALNTFSNSLWF